MQETSNEKRLVLIGDPEKRLREDPVRMLRAVRFAGKLGFTIDKTVVACHAAQRRPDQQRARRPAVR